MYAHLKEVALIYKIINKYPGLHWLSNVYESDKDPMHEYYRLRWLYHGFVAIEILVTSILACPAILVYHNNEEVGSWFLTTIILASIITISAYEITWRFILVPCWIKAKWTTAHFAEDVLDLFAELKQSDAPIRICELTLLAGDGHETKNWLTPGRITELSRARLLIHACNFKKLEMGAEDGDKEAHRTLFNEALAKFQKFKIYPPDFDKRLIYRQAKNMVEKELKENKTHTKSVQPQM